VLKLNAGQTGFYRVSYAPPLLEALGGALGSLPIADRVGLVSDLFALAKPGFHSARLPLEFAQNLQTERSHVVLTEAAAGFDAVREVWCAGGSPVAAALDALAAAIYGPIVGELGWAPAAGEPDTTALLRALAVRAASSARHPATLAEARTRFDAYRGGDASALPPELRGAVFAAVLKTGGEAEYDAIVALYRKEEAQDQKVVLLSSLGAAPAALMPRALEFMLSPDVRNQDAIYLLRSVKGDGLPIAWGFIKA
jgi:aminopeptidase 2